MDSGGWDTVDGEVGRARFAKGSKVAWIVGNEGNGIRDSLLAEVDAVVMIPMLRQTESLNVAQATAVLLYETARQKKSLRR